MIKVKGLFTATLLKQSSTRGEFSCEYQEIFLNGFSVEHLQTAAFVSKFIQNWRLDVVVITTVQLHSSKSELRFCSGSNSASGVSDIYNGDNLS